MCGLAGIFAYHSDAPSIQQEHLELMQQRMLMRGPDGVGYWQDPSARIGLVHRRLSIIDLSAAAAQPMLSSCGRFSIVFNGEIYNYAALKQNLQAKGKQFHTHSDTEVILQLFIEYGPAMLQQLRGMFAIAIWDQQQKTLFLARDPFGIKPLYYADDGRKFYFASQVKALLALPTISREPCAAGHAGFFIWGHVPEPYTLYQSIRAFPAGCYGELSQEGHLKINSYFNIAAEIHLAEQESPALSEAEQQQKLAQTMLDSIQAHLVADVPIGFFLSAGIDSSVLLALAKELNYNTQAITLAFVEYEHSGRDEAPLAKQVATQYQTPWHLTRINAQQFLKEFSKIIQVMDQPSIDGVNTYFVSKAAADLGFKVAVSGAGADELFGGYAIFQRMPRLLKMGRWTRYLPKLFLQNFLHKLFQKMGREKGQGLLSLLNDEASIYLLLRSIYLPEELANFTNAAFLTEGLTQLNSLANLRASYTADQTIHGRVQALESQWYLRNQLLRDTDWAGMAHSLEIRVPYVDIEVWRAVLRLKQVANKKTLFQVPKNSLPAEILSRPKSGFNIPVTQWWRNLPQANLKYQGTRGWTQQIYREFSGI